MPNAKHVVVVGAGFGGMASALRARAEGFEVTLVERLEGLGGRAQTFEREGFKHDAGPTVITAPFLFDELFALFDKKPSDYYEQVPLETWYEFVFEDGLKFKYTGDLEHTYSEIRKFSESDVNGYKKLLALSEKIFNVGFVQLAAKPFNSFFAMLGLLPQLIKLQSYKTVFSLVSTFIKNPYLQKIFSIHPLLVGGNPYTTTSIYTLIHYLERKWGIHFIMGGTTSLVQALERLMTEEGIQIEKGFDIVKIDINAQTGLADSIESQDGRKMSMDAIIYNGDPTFAYENLFDKKVTRCLLYTSPSPRDATLSRMPSSA